MTPPLIVVGAGGHAKVLIDALSRMGREVIGATDARSDLWGTTVLHVPVLGGDEAMGGYSPASCQMVNGIGSVRSTAVRRDVFMRLKAMGFSFASVLHPAAVVSAHARLAEGVQVMAGAVLQVDCQVAANTLINTHASIDHDCRIGAHVHIAPGATLSGGVTIGDGTHVGTGATIVQGVNVGANCLIAAGAVVVRDVPTGSTVRGVPARLVD